MAQSDQVREITVAAGWDINALSRQFQKTGPEIEAEVSQVAKALGQTEAEAAHFLLRYGKPAWYILYRVETNQPLDLPFPSIER